MTKIQMKELYSVQFEFTSFNKPYSDKKRET